MEFKKDILMAYGSQFIVRSYTPYNYKHTAFFFHGLGDVGSTFNPQINFLKANGYKCIYFDFPGCGENNFFSVTSNQILNLLVKIVKQNVSNDNLIIGHSLGGLFALRILSTLQNKYRFTTHIIEGTLLGIDLEFFNSIDTTISNPQLALANILTSDHIPQTYLNTYTQSLKNMSSEMFSVYVNDVKSNLEKYRIEILNNRLVFTYCFGLNSPEKKQRLSLDKYKEISLIIFNNTGHWLHIESSDEFEKRLLNNL